MAVLRSLPLPLSAPSARKGRRRRSCRVRAAEGREEVRVRVERRLPAPPQEAWDAWLKYVWRQGGGLPVLCLAAGDSEGERRALYPARLEEELVSLERGRTVSYRVTDFGLFPALSDHSASVAFTMVEGGDETDLVWDVSFSAPSALRGFWESFTSIFVGTVATNLATALREPWASLSIAAQLPGDPSEVSAAWLDFTWRGGGGLPGPAPSIVSEGERENGVGCARLIVPPGLLERIVSVEGGSGGACVVHYAVENPGFLSLYPVCLHAGSVAFQAAGPGQTALQWTVRYRPLAGCGGFVEWLTRLVVGTLVGKLQERLRK